MAERKKPTRDQVRAWLSTVVAPIREGLGLELQFLAGNNPTFRWHANELEFVSFVDRIIPSIYTPNLLQFWRYHHTLERIARRHDAMVTTIHDRCTRLFHHLLSLPDFQALAASSKSPLSADQNTKFLAQNVINGLKELGTDNLHDEYWQAEGQQYLALRDKPPLKRDFTELTTHTRALFQVAQQLHMGFIKSQEQLADRFGLPPVDPNPLGNG